MRTVAAFVCSVFAGIIFSASAGAVTLTEQEQAFVKDHPAVTVAYNADFSPFTYKDDKGKAGGLVFGFLGEISKISGLTFEPMEISSWTDFYQMALDGEVDLLPAVAYTPEREKEFAMSSSYYNFRNALAIHSSGDWINRLSDLSGRCVAVTRNSSAHMYLLENYPDIIPVFYDSPAEYITAVVTGQEVAAFGNYAHISELLRSMEIKDMTMIPMNTDDSGMHFAASKSNAVLISIIEKSLAEISEKTRNEIINRYVFNQVTNYGDFMRYGALALAAILLIFVISALWIVRLEREVKQRRRVEELLKELNLSKAQFLLRMSHEMRTPMNAVVGLSAIAKRTDDVPQIHQYITQIEQAASHLMNMLNDVLDVSKLENNKLQLVPEPMDLYDITERVEVVAKLNGQSTGLRFEVDVDETVPTRFICDERRLAQVALNLMSNAVKYTPTDGLIIYRVSVESVRGEDYTLKFEFRDTGSGISPERLPHLFDDFEPLEDTALTGTGMGLSIARRLVELMGGRIWVESLVGVGSAFYFTVNVTRTDLVPSHKREQHSWEDNCFAGKRVLIVDDVDINRDIVKELLKPTGITCEIAEDGNDACNKFAAYSERYDIIIMDVQMPIIDGYEATRRIRSMNLKNAKTIPIIAMTANAFKEDIENSIEAGMNDYISKPVSFDEIVRKMWALLPAKSTI